MSIWKMGKADLVCLAQTEAGMSRAVAEAGTVTQLRLMIREIREHRETQERAQKERKLPKGSPGMTHADLLNTCGPWASSRQVRQVKRSGPSGPGSR